MPHTLRSLHSNCDAWLKYFESIHGVASHWHCQSLCVSLSDSPSAVFTNVLGAFIDVFFHHHPCLMFSNSFIDVVFTKPAQAILLQFEWSHVIYAMVLNAFLTVDQTPKTSMLYISYVIVHCSAPTSCGHILYFSLTMLWSFNQMNFWECVLNAGKHLWKTTCYFIFEHNKAALEVKILHSWDLLSINFSELIISRLLYCTFFCLTELIRHSFVGPGFQISFQAECAVSCHCPGQFAHYATIF